MSRIHEALRKAEQERAMAQSGAGVETAPAAVLEPSTDAGVVTSAAVLSAAAPTVKLPAFALLALPEVSLAWTVVV